MAIVGITTSFYGNLLSNWKMIVCTDCSICLSLSITIILRFLFFSCLFMQNYSMSVELHVQHVCRTTCAACLQNYMCCMSVELHVLHVCRTTCAACLQNYMCCMSVELHVLHVCRTTCAACLQNYMCSMSVELHVQHVCRTTCAELPVQQLQVWQNFYICAACLQNYMCYQCSMSSYMCGFCICAACLQNYMCCSMSVELHVLPVLVTCVVFVYVQHVCRTTCAACLQNYMCCMSVELHVLHVCRTTCAACLQNYMCSMSVELHVLPVLVTSVVFIYVQHVCRTTCATSASYMCGFYICAACLQNYMCYQCQLHVWFLYMCSMSVELHVLPVLVTSVVFIYVQHVCITTCAACLQNYMCYQCQLQVWFLYMCSMSVELHVLPVLVTSVVFVYVQHVCRTTCTTSASYMCGFCICAACLQNYMCCQCQLQVWFLYMCSMSVELHVLPVLVTSVVFVYVQHVCRTTCATSASYKCCFYICAACLYNYMCSMSIELHVLPVLVTSVVFVYVQHVCRTTCATSASYKCGFCICAACLQNYMYYQCQLHVWFLYMCSMSVELHVLPVLVTSVVFVYVQHVCRTTCAASASYKCGFCICAACLQNYMCCQCQLQVWFSVLGPRYVQLKKICVCVCRWRCPWMTSLKAWCST